MTPWQALIQDLKDSGLTFAQIASETDAPISTISDIRYRDQGNPRWNLGQKLLALHAERCPDKPRSVV